MPAGERFALPKDFDKSTASYASFAVKLKVLGGASAPYKQIGKSRPRGYNSFPAWKGRFSVALHGWVSEQARDLDEAVREDREVILWSVMGIQIQKIVTTMHAELEKQRKGEEDARVWSLVDLFLHFSEGDDKFCEKLRGSTELEPGDLIKQVGKDVEKHAVRRFAENAKTVLQDVETIEPFVEPLHGTFFACNNRAMGWSLWLSHCAFYLREHRALSQPSSVHFLEALGRLCAEGARTAQNQIRAPFDPEDPRASQTLLKLTELDFASKPEPSMLFEIVHKQLVEQAHSIGKCYASRLSYRQRRLYARV